MDHISLYTTYLQLREEIMKHKWLESEKAGRDIGFDDALIDWTKKHHNNWVKANIKAN